MDKGFLRQNISSMLVRQLSIAISIGLHMYMQHGNSFDWTAWWYSYERNAKCHNVDSSGLLRILDISSFAGTIQWDGNLRNWITVTLFLSKALPSECSSTKVFKVAHSFPPAYKHHGRWSFRDLKQSISVAYFNLSFLSIWTRKGCINVWQLLWGFDGLG